jgi:SOS-response transcriptional repressor LexA
MQNNFQSLTTKQLGVYKYISSHIEKNNISPSVREIASGKKISVSNTQRYLKLLVNYGFISKTTKARSIRLNKHKPISYLATPYSFSNTSSEDEKLQRFGQVTRQALLLFNDGINVYSPITHHHTIAQYGDLISLSTEEWMEFDLTFLSAANQMYVLMLDGWKDSKGLSEEIKYARANHIPIEYIKPSTFVLVGIK